MESVRLVDRSTLRRAVSDLFDAGFAALLVEVWWELGRKRGCKALDFAGSAVRAYME